VKIPSRREKILKPQMHAARPAATKERFKPDLPKRLAALREKGSLKISFRFEKNLTVSSADKRRYLIFIGVDLRLSAVRSFGAGYASP
jgi:hypothetical protein